MITSIIGKDIAKIATKHIINASKSIDIIVYDWRLYPNEIGLNIQQFTLAIIQKAKNGVPVRALIPHADIVQELNKHSIKAKLHNQSKILHTKLMIIDNNIVIIGSHNYTKNAFNINHELSLLIDNEPISDTLVEYFEAMYSNCG